MLKSLFFLFLSVALFARENPFVPLKSSKDIGEATSIKDTRKEFVAQSITLPSSARILKSMELHYQNLDGSIESKVVLIDKNIDWHDEFVLQKLQDKSVTMQEPIPSISDEEEQSEVKIEIKKSVDFQNRLTKDKKLRDFLVTDPYKIVIDFKKDLSFTTKNFLVDVKPFRKVVFGNHNGYYRLVIELDGQYLYNLEETEEGYQIRVK
jgi:hypothetical protein